MGMVIAIVNVPHELSLQRIYHSQTETSQRSMTTIREWQSQPTNPATV